MTRLATAEVRTPTGPARRIGLILGSDIVDLRAVVERFHGGGNPSETVRRRARWEVPADMADLLSLGHDHLERTVEIGLATSASRPEGIVHALSDVKLLAPVPRPPGIACFAAWPSHIADSAAKGYNVQFPTQGSDVRGYYKGNPDSVAGPDSPIEWPSYTKDLDVECELAAVVGAKIRDASREQAAAAIAGYCIFNDISARDVQREEMALGLGPTKGKDMDGGNVFGPWLVTPDELPDPRSLEMRLYVNGDLWSTGNTSDMKWGMDELLAYLSLGQTVRPGHMITSGCYPGGSALDLGRRIRPGDTVDLRIAGIGSLVNQIGTPMGAHA